jgi:hypothetical protein
VVIAWGICTSLKLSQIRSIICREAKERERETERERGKKTPLRGTLENDIYSP